MDMRFSMVRFVCATAITCSLFSGTAQAEDAASPAADPSKSAPAKELNKYDTGLLNERFKLPSKHVDVPLGIPTPSEPSMSRKDWLRIRDRQEEKQNWMFVEPGQITKEREQKEEANFLRDKWDMKEDAKKKSWWEYSDSSSRDGSAAGARSGAGGDKRERIAAEQELRLRIQRERDRDDKTSLDKNRSISSGMDLNGRSKESAEAGHQSSELNMKDLFTGGSGSESKSGRTSGMSTLDLFPTDGSSRERDTSQSQSRRQDFRDFLNASRVSKSSVPDSAGASGSGPGSSSFGSLGATPGNSGLDFLGGSARAAARDSFGSPADFGRAPSATSFAPGSGGFSDSGRSSALGPNSQSQQPAFRSSAAPRDYITPQMMAQPKRRF